MSVLTSVYMSCLLATMIMVMLPGDFLDWSDFAAPADDRTFWERLDEFFAKFAAW